MWSVLASWLAVIVLAAAATNYYNPGLFKGLLPQKSPQPISDIAAIARPEGKRQKQKRSLVTKLEMTGEANSTPTSSNEGTKTKKRKIVSAPIDNTVTARTATGRDMDLPRDNEGSLSNREFAQQLAKAQAGTKLESTATPVANKKNRGAVPNPAAKNLNTKFESSGISTDTSSTTGRDADDDLSPDASPASRPVSTAPTSRAGDVSDMLEPTAAKPATIRLTDISATKPMAPKSAAKTFEPVLNKKQRQRQARQEEQRALREESDRIHEAKKQAQLRSARMAEGSSNQTRANAFTNTPNPWQEMKTAQETSKRDPVPATNTALLDTLNQDAPYPKTNGAVHNEPQSTVSTINASGKNANALKNEFGEEKVNAMAASGRENPTRPKFNPKSHSSWADQVNEEEQNNWANELVQEEKWESVTNKKSKKKAKGDNETSSEGSSSFVRPATRQGRTIEEKVQSNGINSRPENLNRFQSMEKIGGTDLRDAEWEA